MALVDNLVAMTPKPTWGRRTGGGVGRGCGVMERNGGGRGRGRSSGIGDTNKNKMHKGNTNPPESQATQSNAKTRANRGLSMTPTRRRWQTWSFGYDNEVILSIPVDSKLKLIYSFEKLRRHATITRRVRQLIDSLNGGAKQQLGVPNAFEPLERHVTTDRRTRQLIDSLSGLTHSTDCNSSW